MDSSKAKDFRLDELMPLIREQLKAGRNVRFSPRGTSMLPMLRQGVDSVVLSPVPERLEKYDLPLYQRSGGQYVLHRIVQTGETYTCVGDNQFDLETGLRHEQMLALVTGFYRKERYYAVSDWRYRLYCRYWHCSRPLRRLLRRVKPVLRRLLP